MLDLSAMQDVYVTVHVGAGEPGTRGSWMTWAGRCMWAEMQSPADAVMVVPHLGPLGLLMGWAMFVEGQMGDDLFTCTTTDGIGLWMVAAWD